MSMRLIHTILFAILASPLFAQVPELVTDRPDVTESANIVPKGSLQLEHGFSMNVSRDETQLGLLSTLLRYGVNDYFELRGEIFPVSDWEGSLLNTGFTPSSLGMKVRLNPHQGQAPELALLTHYTFSKLATSEWQENFNSLRVLFAAQTGITDRLSAGTNAGFSYTGSSSTLRYVYSVSFGYSLSERIGLFAEQFTESGAAGYPAAFFVDGGATWLVAPLCQLDINGGFSLSEQGSYFLGMGVSWRIDPQTAAL